MKTLLPRAITLTVLLLMVVVAFSVPTATAKKAKPTRSQAGNCSRVDDATLTANVISKISETPGLMGQDVKVEAKSGVVTLTGTVSSSIKKSLAGRTAGSVACVKRVVNKLVIKQPFSGEILCCCDGICWEQTARCPVCSGITTCVEDYKAAVQAAGRDREALAEARAAFETCRCKTASAAP